jgi:hypothetical protein
LFVNLLLFVNMLLSVNLSILCSDMGCALKPVASCADAALPRLHRPLVSLSGLVVGLGERQDVLGRWTTDVLASGQRDGRAVWKTPVKHVDVTQQDLLPGQGPSSSSATSVPWLSRAAIDTAMAFALHLAPSRVVWYLPNVLLEQGVLPSSDSLHRQLHVLLSRNADVPWMAAFRNCTEPGRPGGSHWQLLLYNRQRNQLYVVDPNPVTASISEDASGFFGSIREGGRHNLRVKHVSLGVQRDGSSCGYHVVAAFLVWMGGGDKSRLIWPTPTTTTRGSAMYVVSWGMYVPGETTRPSRCSPEGNTSRYAGPIPPPTPR